jgi:hypothetical protein
VLVRERIEEGCEIGCGEWEVSEEKNGGGRKRETPRDTTSEKQCGMGKKRN